MGPKLVLSYWVRVSTGVITIVNYSAPVRTEFSPEDAHDEPFGCGVLPFSRGISRHILKPADRSPPHPPAI